MNACGDREFNCSLTAEDLGKNMLDRETKKKNNSQCSSHEINSPSSVKNMNEFDDENSQQQNEILSEVEVKIENPINSIKQSKYF